MVRNRPNSTLHVNDDINTLGVQDQTKNEPREGFLATNARSLINLDFVEIFISPTQSHLSSEKSLALEVLSELIPGPSYMWIIVNHLEGSLFHNQDDSWKVSSRFCSVPYGRHHTTSTKATKGLTSHRNGLILIPRTQMTDPLFWKIWGPIKKCSRSRCQLGYPNTRSCAFDNLACKHQKQCHVSVDQRCRPHWCPW